jgi:uncharacterized membrane protein YcaP (DUF421 family)
MTLSDGRQPSYVALLLFLLGLVAGGAAVYAAVNRMQYLLPLAAFLLLTLAASFIVAAGKDEDEQT